VCVCVCVCVQTYIVHAHTCMCTYTHMQGLFLFYWPELCDLFDLKIFVDTESDLRLARRLKRDTQERGRNLMGMCVCVCVFVFVCVGLYVSCVLMCIPPTHTNTHRCARTIRARC